MKTDTVYQVPFEITPVGDYCGSCRGWGEIAMAGDFCRVFCRPLHFYDGDPECNKKGYRRCAECLAWEQAFLAGKLEAVCCNCASGGCSTSAISVTTGG